MDETVNNITNKKNELISNSLLDNTIKNELKKVEENPSAYIQSNVPDNEEGVTINA